ncbi:MAG: flippase [Pyrinomonadaceae bacterium]
MDDQPQSDDLAMSQKTTEGSKIGSSILSLGSGEIIARAVAFFGVSYAARVLGPEQFGIIGFAAALFGYLSLSVTAGFADIGSREIARRPREASSIAANVVAMRLIIAALALIAIAVIAAFLNKPPTVKLVLLLMGLLFFPLALDTSWVYKGLEKNRPVAFALIIGQILYVGAIFIAVREPSAVAFVPLAQFFGEICAALILLIPLFWIGKIQLDLREGLHLLLKSGFWAISRVMRALTYTFDIVLIGFLLGEREVGLYTAPYRICMLLIAMAVSVYASYLPIIIRAASKDLMNPEIGFIAERSLNFGAAVAAPLVVGGIMVAKPLVVAVFGTDYAAGSTAFQFILLSIGLVFLHGALHNVFLAVNRLKTEMMIFAAAAVLNIGLNIIIIPRYGIVGAAVVTAITEFATLVCGLIVINRIGVSFSLRPIWRPLVSSLFMGGALFLLGMEHGLIPQLVAGGGSYLLALAIVRGIPPDIRYFFQKRAF